LDSWQSFPECIARIEIPVQQSARIPPENSLGPLFMQENKFSILIVEDHPFQLIGVQMHLNRLGFFRLTPALDAGEARQACARRHEPFDLLLCDINLPGTDGIELAWELAEAGRIRQAVLLSGRDENELRALQQRLSAQGLPILACLPKPLNQSALIQALEAGNSVRLLEQTD
jgi:CheY-like chemotaxis protein